jgi:hypothetical protein
MATSERHVEQQQDQNGGPPGAERDIDPAETAEWLEALDAVARHDGPERAKQILEALFADARRRNLHPAGDLSTPYVNTIPVEYEEQMPGDPEVEHRLRSWVRWNAIATVLQANAESSELGGHIASYQSAATLYEVGFNHFWHAPTEGTAATSSTSRATRRRASTPARSSRAASARTRCGASAPRRSAPGCRRTRTPGSCRTSGSSPRSRWGSGRSWRSTRRGS